jgi:carboxypeptidase D
MNPDGFELATEGDAQGVNGRANAHNKDLNRNFPDQYRPGDNGVLEPEAAAVMAWSRQFPFVLSANLHGGSLVANYPFDDTPNKMDMQGRSWTSPDDATFQLLARVYSLNHPKMKTGIPCGQGGQVQFPDGITNGAHWYSVAGGMQDWNYLRTNDFEITLELGCTKYPDHQKLEAFWTDNKESLLAFMEAVHLGFKGFVLDTEGQPVANATVTVEGIDHSVTTTGTGDYWRLLAPGTYIVSALAPGYDVAKQKVKVGHALFVDADTGQAGAKVVNFTLQPDSNPMWSEMNDFDLSENIKEVPYRSNNEVKAALGDLENRYSGVAEAMINEADWSTVIPGLKLEAEGNASQNTFPKVAVLLVGGLFGSQPLGREVLLRFAAHLAEGYKRLDNVVVELLSRATIYILPAVDMSRFEEAVPGTCRYSGPVDREQEAGASFTEQRNLGTEAMKRFLARFRIKLALSLEAGGLFMRTPWDKAVGGSKATGSDALFQQLADAYRRSHQGMKGPAMACDGRRITGSVAGSSVQGVDYGGSMQDYLWQKYNVPMVTAHISCCNFPSSPRAVVAAYKDNLNPLIQFLETVYQGVWGRVTDSANQPLANVTVEMAGKVEVTDQQGVFITVFPEGKYRMVLSHDKYERKSVDFQVEAGRMVRRDAVLDSTEESAGLAYHTGEQALATLRSLQLQYPGQASLVQHPGLDCIVVSTNLTAGGERPAVRVVGWSPLGAELALSLAQYLVTRVGRDDLVTALLRKFDIHIGFGKRPEKEDVKVVQTGTCPEESFHRGSKLAVAVAAWDKGVPFLFGLNFMSGFGNLLVAGGTEGICHQAAQVYLDTLEQRDPGSQCAGAAARKIESESAGRTPELQVGASCCPRPEALGRLWDTHRRAALAALASGLQGIHGELRDAAGTLLAGSKLTITVNSTVDTFETDRYDIINRYSQYTFHQRPFLAAAAGRPAGAVGLRARRGLRDQAGRRGAGRPRQHCGQAGAAGRHTARPPSRPLHLCPPACHRGLLPLPGQRWEEKSQPVKGGLQDCRRH